MFPTTPPHNPPTINPQKICSLALCVFCTRELCPYMSALPCGCTLAISHKVFMVPVPESLQKALLFPYALAIFAQSKAKATSNCKEKGAVTPSQGGRNGPQIKKQTHSVSHSVRVVDEERHCISFVISSCLSLLND